MTKPNYVLITEVRLSADDIDEGYWVKISLWQNTTDLADECVTITVLDESDTKIGSASMYLPHLKKAIDLLYSSSQQDKEENGEMK